MKMTLTVKGSEMVKPMESVGGGSLWLSSLDLVFPDNYHTSMVCYYRSDGGAAANFFDTAVLKAALSRALVEFYPYAGRLRKDDDGRLEINCNGEGVFFSEAECDGTVDDLDGDGFNPRPDLSLVPNVDYSNGIASFPLFLVQSTRFKCGGVSLGSTIDHHVADAISVLYFVNTWAKIARGLTPAVPPSLDRRRLLSPQNPPRPEFPHIEHHLPPSLKAVGATPPHISGERSISTFRLAPSHIKALKQKCGGGGGYTTYEVVAGHAWRCVSIARGLPEDQETKLQIPVETRRRLQPPLPPGFFGNRIFFTAALASCGELRSKPVGFAAEKVREAIRRTMDNAYLKSAIDYVELHRRRGGKAAEGILRHPANVTSPNFAIVSWVGMPFYEADFGWGKPVYCGRGRVMDEGMSFLNVDPHSEEKGSLLLTIALYKEHMLSFEKLFYGVMSSKI